jgi:glycosyltransferase involved in cell wall biosynthesis
MKICSSIIPKEPWGGSSQFAKHLIKYLLKEGVEIIFDLNTDYDVLYLNSWVLPYQTASGLRNQGKKILHRIDGIGKVYGRERDEQDKLQLALNELAHFTIYQSEFCKQLCLDYGFNTDEKNSAVIYNGTDPSIFYPGSRKRADSKTRFLSVSWSSNLNKGFPMLADLSNEFDVTFIGRWNEQINPQKIKIIQASMQAGVSEVMRDCDVLLHLSKYEACSNVIIEALSCGLPVIFDDSGGNREVVGDAGLPFTKDNMLFIKDDLLFWREKAVERSKMFSIENIGRQYLDKLLFIYNKK